MLSRIISNYYIIALIFAIFCISNSHAEITAESVLGEYWKDPLFGQAASDTSIEIEILNGRIWPTTVDTTKNQTLRLLFINKSEEDHMMAISEDLTTLINDPDFTAFVADEIFHAKQMRRDGRHIHTHSGSDIDTAKSIVSDIETNPTVYIPAQDRKEILLSLNKATKAEFACVIKTHANHILRGVINIE